MSHPCGGCRGVAFGCALMSGIILAAAIILGLVRVIAAGGGPG